MDEDLSKLTREQLVAEVKRLRAGIRAHRDASGHELCWHHPQLWGLLPEPIPEDIAVPEWPEFLRGCIKYRESLDLELPNAPRTTAEFNPILDRIDEDRERELPNAPRTKVDVNPILERVEQESLFSSRVRSVWGN